MNNYEVTVNGKKYQVSISEIQGDMQVETKPTQVASSAPIKREDEISNGIKVEAPMPGVILDIKVSQGQKVNAGDTLCILEAMKMENEVVAPSDGVVSAIHVSKGNTIEAGTTLFTL